MTRQASSKTCRRSAAISISIRTEKVMRRGAAPAGAGVGGGSGSSAAAASSAPAAAGSCRGRSSAGCGSPRANGQSVEAAALQEVDAAAIARPLRLARRIRRRRRDRRVRGPRAGIGHGGVEAGQARAVLGDGVHAGPAARGRRRVVGGRRPGR